MNTTADIIAAIRQLSEGGECRATLTAIAEAAGVSKRTIIRALRVLERRGLIRREGRERAVGVVRLVTAAPKDAICHHGRRVYEDPTDLTPGAEYTPIKDRAAVVADRVEYYRRTGRTVPAAWLAELARATLKTR